MMKPAGCEEDKSNRSIPQRGTQTSGLNSGSSGTSSGDPEARPWILVFGIVLQV
jgi:hypothetical protein